MKANELMDALIRREAYIDKLGGFTVDCCKAGDPEREIKRVAVCLTATTDVLREASEWGAQQLITHEPTFYVHDDSDDGTTFSAEKRRQAAESGLTIYRWHDSSHFAADDAISEAFIEALGWRGSFDGQVGFVLDEAKNPLDIAREISEKLDIRHPRIVGCRGGMVKKLFLLLGHRGDEWYIPFNDGDGELAICGELCEWHNAEPVRDMAQSGRQKTMIVLGHAASEREGMKYLARRVEKEYPQLEVKYFECGELYTYAD